ncbi:MAG TPA: hypothetical protein VJ044_03045, partial [Candidatus Hodarchaeales archaeon]|nr:hypothetical protein [Candidatus Hodarchaeales archaeon]
MDKDDDEEIRSAKIFGKLEDMDNKLERIKSDTHNLNRIASLSNAGLIVQELKKIIGRSEIRAAILHLTKNEIKAGDLASKLGVDPRHLAMYLQPFLGNKGYIAVIEKGRERYFQRSELVDLIGYDSIEEFVDLIKSWEQKRQGPVAATSAPGES